MKTFHAIFEVGKLRPIEDNDVAGLNEGEHVQITVNRADRPPVEGAVVSPHRNAGIIGAMNERVHKEDQECEDAKQRFMEEGAQSTVLPHIVDARKAFLRDLPELIEKYPNQWAAHHETEMIAVDADRRKLEQICRDQGFGFGKVSLQRNQGTNRFTFHLAVFSQGTRLIDKLPFSMRGNSSLSNFHAHLSTPRD